MLGSPCVGKGGREGGKEGGMEGEKEREREREKGGGRKRFRKGGGRSEKKITYQV